jgi:NADPH:quinone reductase-like Zn-dependent oxidoreductase
MRAVVCHRYGPPDVLQIEDVAQPVPADDEVLVRVHATTVNRTDCGFRRPEPFIVRFFSGLLRPKRPILGTEVTGEVDAAGAGLNRSPAATSSSTGRPARSVSRPCSSRPTWART